MTALELLMKKINIPIFCVIKRIIRHKSLFFYVDRINLLFKVINSKQKVRRYQNYLLVILTSHKIYIWLPAVVSFHLVTCKYINLPTFDYVNIHENVFICKHIRLFTK